MSVVVGALVATLVLAVVRPRVRSSTELSRALRTLHEGMLNQQTGLRAWLSTGDERFLASVALGRRQVETQNDRLVDLLQGDAKVDRDVLDLRLDEEAWLEGWAEGAALADPDQLDAVALGALLAEDERLFAAYRRTQVDLNASFSARRDQALDQERASL
ncbi:MAG: CHASE3 domain-containing protein, partial [Actinomycetota bacterium]|nr:CHASE3 domain-containing protein [Actinomycetota bacterium]